MKDYSEVIKETFKNDYVEKKDDDKSKKYLLNYVFNEKENSYTLYFMDGEKGKISAENTDEKYLKELIKETFNKMFKEYVDSRFSETISKKRNKSTNIAILIGNILTIGSAYLSNVDQRLIIAILFFEGGYLFNEFLDLNILEKKELYKEFEFLANLVDGKEELVNYFKNHPDELDKTFDRIIDELTYKGKLTDLMEDDINKVNFQREDIRENGINLNNYDLLDTKKILKNIKRNK